MTTADISAVRVEMLKSPQYLGGTTAAGAYIWRRKDSGHIISGASASVGRGAIGILSVVGLVSSSRYDVNGIGAWRSTSSYAMEKAKFGFLLEKPVGTAFAEDWDLALKTIRSLQLKIGQPERSRNFIIPDAVDEMLRFTKPVFFLKGENTKTNGISFKMWEVDDGDREQFLELEDKYRFEPLVVYDQFAKKLNPFKVGNTLKGCLVEVSFKFRHYEPRDADGKRYNSFTGEVAEVTILHGPVEMEEVAFVGARAFRAGAGAARQTLIQDKDTTTVALDSVSGTQASSVGIGASGDASSISTLSDGEIAPDTSVASATAKAGISEKGSVDPPSSSQVYLEDIDVPAQGAGIKRKGGQVGPRTDPAKKVKTTSAPA